MADDQDRFVREHSAVCAHAYLSLIALLCTTTIKIYDFWAKQCNNRAEVADNNEYCSTACDPTVAKPRHNAKEAPVDRLLNDLALLSQR